MTLAIVKVLPLPVTPRSTWCFFPARRLSTSFRIASGWSPFGWNSLVSLNNSATPSLPTRTAREERAAEC